MKWIITKIFISTTVALAILILFIGLYTCINADSFSLFFIAFSPYLITSAILLVTGAIFGVILVGICQIVDNLKIMNSTLSGKPIEDMDDKNQIENR